MIEGINFSLEWVGVGPFNELLSRRSLQEASYHDDLQSLQSKDRHLNPLLAVFQYWAVSFFVLSVRLWTFVAKQGRKVKSGHTVRAGLGLVFLIVWLALVA